METMVPILAAAALLLFLFVAGIAVVLIVVASLVGLLGGIVQLVRQRARRSEEARDPLVDVLLVR